MMYFNKYMKVVRTIRRVHSQQDGFTLIEVIVVIAIMGILIALLSSGMRNMMTRQIFTTTVTDVRDGIIAMRQQTLASSNDTLYGVYVSSTAVALFEGNSFVEGDAANVVFDLPDTMSATTSLSGDVVSATFTRLSGIPSATGTIVLTDSVYDRTATITISGTGLVE